ncbi:TPA: tyrosine-type recombinase/integrase [Bacillus cereus]|nr:tyrosine-type recombinase/integrase [Bacillus cereus]HDR6312319.1 tyrosine-type recombinase/integrase [Bacillus cereus]
MSTKPKKKKRKPPERGEKKKKKVEKEKQKRKAKFKLSKAQLKKYGLEYSTREEIREVEKIREWAVKIHTIGKESNICIGGENMAFTTRKNYETKTIKVLTDIHLKTKKNIFSITQEDISNHIYETYSNNYTASAYIAALGYTQTVINKDETLFRVKPELLIRNADNTAWTVKEDHQDRDWIRRAKDSTTKKGTYEEIKRLKEEVEKSGYSQAHKEQVLKMIDLCAALGLRVSEAIGMTYGDILAKGESLHTQGKGGHHRHNNYSLEGHDDQARQILQDLYNSPENTNPNKKIFEFRTEVKRDKDGRYIRGGEIMSDQAIQERIGKMIRTCADRAGINDKDKTFSMHSIRKYYAQSRVDYYKKFTLDQLKQEVNEKLAENKRLRKEEKERVRKEKLAGKTKAQINERKYPNLEKKLETLRDRINWVEKPSKKNPEGVRRTKEWRDAEEKELIFFLVSLSIGHQRVESAPLHSNVYRIILLNGETLIYKTTCRAKFHEIWIKA